MMCGNGGGFAVGVGLSLFSLQGKGEFTSLPPATTNGLGMFVPLLSPFNVLAFQRQARKRWKGERHGLSLSISFHLRLCRLPHNHGHSPPRREDSKLQSDRPWKGTKSRLFLACPKAQHLQERGLLVVHKCKSPWLAGDPKGGWRGCAVLPKFHLAAPFTTLHAHKRRTI
jgi:hypothetical protein